MKKILRFSFLVTAFEKRALERLAKVNGESQGSYLRRLIRQSIEQQRSSHPIKDIHEQKLIAITEIDPAEVLDIFSSDEVSNGK